MVLISFHVKFQWLNDISNFMFLKTKLFFQNMKNGLMKLQLDLRVKKKGVNPLNMVCVLDPNATIPTSTT